MILSYAFNINLFFLSAEIQVYILEKSRVVQRNRGEGNFHIFYDFLEGLPSEAKGKFGLQPEDRFRYFCREDLNMFSILFSTYHLPFCPFLRSYMQPNCRNVCQNSKNSCMTPNSGYMVFYTY